MLQLIKHNVRLFLKTGYLPFALAAGYIVEHIYILFQQNKYQLGQLDTYLNITLKRGNPRIYRN